jgi:S1-C subfamily serine protease
MTEHDTTQPPAPRRRRRALAAAAAALTLAGGLGAVALGSASAATVAGSAVAASSQIPARYGYGAGGGSGWGTADGASSGTTASSAARQATAQESVGVVDVTTVLDYGQGRAAGTGIVLTSGGEILTNNHVVQDSTAITVTVVSTGATYTATVVGTDATDDVAVLQLKDASGLTPAVLASSSAQAAVTTGTAVTAVGNAGGTGGTPSAADGTVLALGQTITAGDESGGSSERLSGMIEVAADIEAGDSGGPLYAGGAVVGIDTAASASSAPTFHTASTTGNAGTTGYAIPIGTALDIAQRIVGGEDSDTITQGYPAFLGVELASAGGTASSSAPGGGASGGGATISGVVEGSPAAAAGLAQGDTVTAVDGTDVGSAAALGAALATHAPGDQVRVSWTDGSGATRSATITLTQGPAR